MRAGGAAAAQRRRSGVRAVLRLLVRAPSSIGASRSLFLVGVLRSRRITSKGSNIFLSLGNLLRRAAAGVDHRARRDRHDAGHPDRRHRSVGRLGDGVRLGDLRHAADPAGLDRRPPSWACRRSRWWRSPRCSRWCASCFAGLAKARAGAGRRTGGAAAARLWSTCGCRASVGVAAALALPCGRLAQVPGQVRRARRAAGGPLRRPAVRRASTALIIVDGRLQPFIVTLAMMVSALGLARLTAGPGQCGAAGLYRHQRHRRLRRCCARWSAASCRCRACSSSRAIADLRRGAAVHDLRPLRLRDRRQRGGDAALGHRVGQVKIATYALSGLLAGIAGVLYVAQYRQGKPDAGAGLELDAIAAVVIGGTSLMGGRGGLAGTFVGVLIFGLLSNILQLHNINSNVQLLLKGMIIVGTVLVQERNRRPCFCACLRPPAARPARRNGRRGERPRKETAVQPTRGDLDMKRRDVAEAGGVTVGGRRAGHCRRAGARPRARRTRSGRSASRRRPRSSPGGSSSTRTSRPRRQAPGGRADHHRRRGQDREAGRRRREPHPPGSRRAP